jgi:hypothetical protein
LLWPGAALAAEILQVRGATLLQLGDQNRSYTVQLACIVVPESQQSEAVDWLRQVAPRLPNTDPAALPAALLAVRIWPAVWLQPVWLRLPLTPIAAVIVPISAPNPVAWVDSVSLNRTAKGIVLVPSLLLGGAFLAAGVWSDGPAASNKMLALSLGGVLMAAGLLAQLLPDSKAEESDPD